MQAHLELQDLTDSVVNLVPLDPLDKLVPPVVLAREVSLGHKVLKGQEVHLESVDRMELLEEMDNPDREENKDHKVLRVNQDLQEPVVNQVQEVTLEHVENLDYLVVMVSSILLIKISPTGSLIRLTVTYESFYYVNRTTWTFWTCWLTRTTRRPRTSWTSW